MFIAIATEGKDLESQVSANFELCKYLLIVDMESLDIEVIENNSDLLDESLARIIIEYDCEAIITGKLTPEAFEIIADACITRYTGFGYSVKEALDLMAQYSLELIRNVDGTDGCGGDHHENSYDGHHHDNE